MKVSGETRPLGIDELYRDCYFTLSIAKRRLPRIFASETAPFCAYWLTYYASLAFASANSAWISAEGSAVKSDTTTITMQENRNAGISS